MTNSKLIMTMAVMVVAMAFIGISLDAESEDGATYSAKSLYDGGSGSISLTPQSVTINDAQGTQGIYYTASPSSFTLSSGSSVTVRVYQTDGSYDDDFVTIVFSGSTVTTYSVTITANNGGTVSGNTSFSVPSGTSISASGNRITVGSYSATATANTNYVFSGWSRTSGTITGNTTITASFTYVPPVTYYSVTITANTGGTVSGNTSFSVASGTSISANGNTITIGSYSATATANTNYVFSGWSRTSGTITGNTTITASFSSLITVSSVAPTSPSTAVITLSATGYTSSTASNGATASLTVPAGTPVTFSASQVTGWTFHGWYDANDSTEGIDPDNPSTMTFYSSQTYNGEYYIIQSLVTFDAATNGGTVTGSSTKTVSYGQPYGTLPTASKSGSAFNGWFTEATGGTQVTASTIVSITSAQTLYAQFTTPFVYWSNDLQNGSIDITFRYSATNNVDHNMIIPLYSGVTDAQNVTTWTDTGMYLDITVAYADTVITVDLYGPGDTKLMPTSTTDLGHWSKFTLSIDSNKGVITFTPIDRFENFTAFSTMDSQSRELANWSSVANSNSMREIIHSETGTSGNRPTFSVTGTATFLNTYGVVMTNPSINVYDYFPQYDNVRLNMYAFALYGDLMTVNGIDFPVTNGSVTIYYTENNKVYTIATPDTEGALSKTFTLSNIYITWEGGRCSLTFVNDNFTVGLGDFSAGSETVSFDGFWYFTSYLYEPYTAYETVIDGDWDYLPDLSSPAIILILLGTLLVGGLIAHVKIGLKWLDMTIMTASLVFIFALLG